MLGFLKNHHYVWETGLTGHYTYAPLGKALKNNLENFIRREFRVHEFQEIETALIYRQRVWQASGHWDKFQDPVIYTTDGKCFRLDKLLEEEFPDLNYSELSFAQVKAKLETINQRRLATAIAIKADDLEAQPEVKLFEIPSEEIQYHNLMMTTLSGQQPTGLRPETATATYYHFEQLLEANHHLYPIRVFQIGKSFRNEISPKHNLLRGREFTQAEFQLIIPTDRSNDREYLTEHNPELVPYLDVLIWYTRYPIDSKIEPIRASDLPNTSVYFQALIGFAWSLFQNLGFTPSENLRIRSHTPQEIAKSIYATSAYDLEIKLKHLGWYEVAGLHDRGIYDLRNQSSPPNVLELAIGIDRLIYAIIDNLYQEKKVSEGKSMLILPYHLAPVQVSVLPLVKNKPEIVNKAKEVRTMLKRQFITEYSEKKSIGKRYLINAQKGIPYSITIDFQTLEDQTVTVRDRNTEKQIRLSISELMPYLFYRIYT